MYQHHNWQDALPDYPVSRVVCVGSNYIKRIKETDSATPEEPMLFTKPETAPCDLRQPLVLPEGLGPMHYEVELAVLIGSTLRQATEKHVQKGITGYSIALDLTPRDLQAKMKKAGQPWERAKGFDNAGPVSDSIPVTEFYDDPQNTPLGLKINSEVRRQGTIADMIHKIMPLITYISRFFTLKAGGVILTSTPEKVGPLRSSDELEADFNGLSLVTRVLQALLAVFWGDKTCIGIPDWL